MEVPRTPTALTRPEMAALFVPAYVLRFGELPDRDRAEMLLALACMENANGKAIIQFNWGNVSVFPSDAIMYWRPPWFDLATIEALPEGPKKARLLDFHQRMVDHKAPSAFLALPSHEAGLDRWLHDLQRRPTVLAAASAGDPIEFAHRIFDSKYCPDVECRDAGPSYGKIRDEIRAAGLFSALASVEKKKSVARARELPGLWFWCWGLLLSRRTSGTGSAAAALRTLSGEP